jgi:hypothetical protein
VTDTTEIGRGWAKISGQNASGKWHFFGHDGRSLCGKYAMFGKNILEQGNDDSTENCVRCRGRLSAMKLRATALSPISQATEKT